MNDNNIYNFALTSQQELWQRAKKKKKRAGEEGAKSRLRENVEEKKKGDLYFVLTLAVYRLWWS